MSRLSTATAAPTVELRKPQRVPFAAGGTNAGIESSHLLLVSGR